MVYVIAGTVMYIQSQARLQPAEFNCWFSRLIGSPYLEAGINLASNSKLSKYENEWFCTIQSDGWDNCTFNDTKKVVLEPRLKNWKN